MENNEVVLREIKIEQDAINLMWEIVEAIDKIEIK